MKFISLRKKIVYITISVIIVNAIVLSSIIYIYSRSEIHSNAVTTVRNDAELISSNIENALNKIESDIRFISKTPPIQGIIRSTQNGGQDTLENSDLTIWKNRLSVIFTSLLQVNPWYTQVRYIGVANNGKEIVRVNQTNNQIYLTSEMALQTKGNRNYFNKAVDMSPGTIVFSQIDFNMENGKLAKPLVPTIRVLTPIYDESQMPFGVLVINVDIEKYIEDVFSHSNFKYDALIYNKYFDTFQYQASSNKVTFYKNIAKASEQLDQNMPVFQNEQFLNSLLRNKNNISVVNTIYSDKSRRSEAFKLLLSVPKKAIYNDSIFGLILFIGSIIVFSIISSWVVSHYVRALIAPLTRMARQLNVSQKTSYELPLQLNDELGILARAFHKKTEQLSKLGLYDSLTGLPNRKNLIEHLNEAIVRARRHAKYLAVIFIDLNDFKKINDTYGHDYGDELLIQFSMNLKKATREADFCARLSGDEFTIIAEDIESEEQVDAIISRYQKALNRPYDLKGVTVPINISGGLSLYPDDGTTSKDLLIVSDRAMYQSKKFRQGEIVKFIGSSSILHDRPSDNQSHQSQQ